MFGSRVTSFVLYGCGVYKRFMSRLHWIALGVIEEWMLMHYVMWITNTFFA